MSNLRHQIHEIIFEAETPAGKAFDIALLVAIVLSVIAVLLESVTSISTDYGAVLSGIEWAFTILFTIEYLLRVWTVRHPVKYMGSFFGVIDLMSVLPTYLSILLPGTQSLIVIRAFRLLRVFRVLKLGRFLSEGNVLLMALRSSKPKIIVFLMTVLIMVTLLGTAMYLIEGEVHGFTSIPRSIYWAIVTMTTVGYGDITPQTVPGQILASVIMILGYGIIAVPTGIVSAELSRATHVHPNTIACHHCSHEGHDLDAKYCRICGEILNDEA